MNRKNSIAANEFSEFNCSMFSIEAKMLLSKKNEDNNQFSNLQNTPNPFNEATVISFALTNFSNVKIEIFDLEGKKIMDLCNQKMEAGNQMVLLYKYSNIGQLSEGSYIYEMTAENENGRIKECNMLTVIK